MMNRRPSSRMGSRDGSWNLTGIFLGYTGFMPAHSSHPLGPHVEIGWRLVREAWGRGQAKAALGDAFSPR